VQVNSADSKDQLLLRKSQSLPHISATQGASFVLKQVMGNPVSSPHTAANATKRTQHQAPRRGQHQAPRRGQQNYAHELPQSDDSHMRLRLLG